MSNQVIDLGYRPREWQAELHRDASRFKVCVLHRRAGKTVYAILDTIDAALRCTLKRPRYAYVAPFLKQAKTVAWDYVKEYGLKIPGAAVNEAELRLDLPNGARFTLFGADNYDAMRGVYLDGVVLDEFGDMDPRAWQEVIRPALSDRKGWATFIGTPKGRNGFYDLFATDKQLPGRLAYMLKASASGLIEPSELIAAQQSMTADQYAQEYECSFEAAIQGAFYAAELQLAEEQGRLTGVPYDPASLVHTAWDLGIDDATAIWFIQEVGRELHVIDFMEVSGEGLPDIVDKLRAKPYRFGNAYLPHDVQARELGTGRTRKETLESLGVRDIKVVPAQSVADGINATRMMMGRMWFDKTRCERGVECLYQYRREWDEKRKVFRDRPLHDWTSHAADALRSFGNGYSPARPVAKRPMSARPSGWMAA